MIKRFYYLYSLKELYMSYGMNYLKVKLSVCFFTIQLHKFKKDLGLSAFA